MEEPAVELPLFTGPQASSYKRQASSLKLQVSRKPHPERGWGLIFYFPTPTRSGGGGGSHPRRGWGKSFGRIVACPRNSLTQDVGGVAFRIQSQKKCG